MNTTSLDKCQAYAKEMSLGVYNGTAIQGREAAARAACLERHRACRDMAEVETGEGMAVQEGRQQMQTSILLHVSSQNGP